MILATELYEWLVFGHVLAAMVWLGGAILLAVLVSQTIREGEPDAVARFVANLRVIGPAVLAPATVAVVGFGIWLVLESPAWDFSQTWIEIALGLFAAAFVIGAAHQSRAAIKAERAVDRGDADDALRQLVRWSWGYRVIVLLLIAVTWDMVTRPGI